jgi:hypothetical protein
MVEAGAKHAGQRGKGADVAAQVTAFWWVQAVGLTTMAMAFQRM